MERLEVAGLSVDAFDEAIAAHRRLVSDVGFVLRSGEALGVTGESGSGKTTLSLALGGLSPPASRVTARHFVLQYRGGPGMFPCSLDLSGSDARLGTQLRRLRGRQFFTLFQEPRASLNPYRTVGWQLERCRRRAIRAVGRLGSDGADSASAPTALRALDEVGLDRDLLRYYPHELSTGMCQRVFLAMAYLLGSSVLVADEPFASLDAENQHRLSRLVADWVRTRGIVLVLVSHDLDLLRELTQQTLVMYRGQAAELGPTGVVLGRGQPAHPYTRLLRQIGASAESFGRAMPGGGLGNLAVPCWFASRCKFSDERQCVEQVPRWRSVAESSAQLESAAIEHQVRCVRFQEIEAESGRLAVDRDPVVESATTRELLRVRGLVKDFATGWIVRRHRRVLDGVTFSMSEGERLGILGPSGQGKTTLARLVLGVLRTNVGSVELADAERWIDVLGFGGLDRTRLQNRVQMLYQDTDLVLDPATRVDDALIEAYQVFDSGMSRPVAYELGARLLDELFLPREVLEAYPHRLSGGERKRVALARSLAALGCPFPASANCSGRLLLLDEPTAGVDVFLQAGIARFLLWVQLQLRLSYLVISHDESFVRRFCHRSLQMRNGRVLPETLGTVSEGNSAP